MDDAGGDARSADRDRVLVLPPPRLPRPRRRPGLAPTWAVDPARPRARRPPAGRSLFDFAVTREVAGQAVHDVPFPFERLVKHLEARAGCKQPCAKQVLIPLGRSLQRTAAAPAFFEFPRVVAAIDAEPAAPGAPLLKDRIYVGYQERSNLLEVISYNEAAGRFEFQVVRDYRELAAPGRSSTRAVRCARRAIRISRRFSRARCGMRPMRTRASPRSSPAPPATVAGSGRTTRACRSTAASTCRTRSTRRPTGRTCSVSGSSCGGSAAGTATWARGAAARRSPQRSSTASPTNARSTSGRPRGATTSSPHSAVPERPLAGRHRHSQPGHSEPRRVAARGCAQGHRARRGTRPRGVRAARARGRRSRCGRTRDRRLHAASWPGSQASSLQPSRGRSTGRSRPARAASARSNSAAMRRAKSRGPVRARGSSASAPAIRRCAWRVASTFAARVSRAARSERLKWTAPRPSSASRSARERSTRTPGARAWSSGQGHARAARRRGRDCGHRPCLEAVRGTRPGRGERGFRTCHPQHDRRLRAGARGDRRARAESGDETPLAARTFSRTRVLAPLFARLGVPVGEWCCEDAARFPPVPSSGCPASRRASRRAPRPRRLTRLLSRLRDDVTTTAEALPPNFLAGTASSASTRA